MEQEMWTRLSELQVAPFEMFQAEGWDYALVSYPLLLAWFPDLLLGLVH